MLLKLLEAAVTAGFQVYSSEKGRAIPKVNGSRGLLSTREENCCFSNVFMFKWNKLTDGNLSANVSVL